ncbi:hypothetical protein [Candidatus Spongiihabitans sp.]|uniref:hypothetical protein n=1 Tax=Candidatus Spongiihabitans sp. TaxID=3101308 RepID=UPI003C6EEDA9
MIQHEVIGFLGVAFGVLLSGCATITKGTTDTLQVTVSNCGEPIECTASNKKGSWPFTAPGPVIFKNSDDDLNIVCQDGDSVITQRVSPVRGEMA